MRASYIDSFIFRWADQCSRGHDKNRRSKEFRWVGQNAASLYGHDGDDSKLTDMMITNWYDEVMNLKIFATTEINKKKI